MIKIYQDKFGSPSGPKEELGNCYPACVATIMGLGLEDVPHFYAKGYEWWDICGWVSERGFRLLPFGEPIHEDWRRIFNGCVAIFTGPSPRFDDGTMHAVVGRITLDGWDLLHDPHPEGDGFSGPPEMAEIFLRDADCG